MAAVAAFFIVCGVQADTLFKQAGTVLGPVNIVNCATNMTCAIDGGQVDINAAADSFWQDAGPCITPGCNLSGMPINHIFTPNLITNVDGGPALFLSGRGQNPNIFIRPYVPPQPTLTLANDSSSFTFPTIEFRTGNPPTSATAASWIFNSNTDFQPPVNIDAGGLLAPGPGVGVNIMAPALSFVPSTAPQGLRTGIRFNNSGIQIYPGNSLDYIQSTGTKQASFLGQPTATDSTSIVTPYWPIPGLYATGYNGVAQITPATATPELLVGYTTPILGSAILGGMYYYAFQSDGGVVPAQGTRTERVCNLYRRPTRGAICIPTLERAALVRPTDGGWYGGDGGGSLTQIDGITTSCEVLNGEDQYPTDAGSLVVCLLYKFHNYTTSDKTPTVGIYNAVTININTPLFFKTPATPYDFAPGRACPLIDGGFNTSGACLFPLLNEENIGGPP